MNIRFKKISRGPAWERWAILEAQNGDDAIAGEVILTYSDINGYAETDCDILFTRELAEEEIDYLFDEVASIVSDSGTVTLFTTQMVVSKEFSYDEFEDEEEEEEGLE